MKIKYIILITGALFIGSNYVTFKLTQANYLKNINQLKTELGDIRKMYEEMGNNNTQINEKIDNIEERVNLEEQKIMTNEELSRKIECLELVKKTPETGNMMYIGVDIVGYYNNAKEHYDAVQRGDFRREGDEEDNRVEKEDAIKEYNEAKVLYDEYSRLCQ